MALILILPLLARGTGGHDLYGWKLGGVSCITCFKQGLLRYEQRDYREGWWSLLTVETEANGDSRSILYRVLHWLVCWACRADTRKFYPVLAALFGQVQNVYPHYTLFNSVCPYRSATWAGSRATSLVY